MKRHPFEPGKLVVGLVILGVGVAYALDATGRLDVPAAVPLVVPVGLVVAGLVSALSYRARRRSRRAERLGTIPPRDLFPDPSRERRR